MSQRAWIASVPFILTVAVSSATLFLLQPMCARMILPYLGGSHSVWTTCMLFFQAGLLGGYLYAHASSRIGIRVHLALHLVLVALACVFLPPVLDRHFVSYDGSSPVAWLLWSLVTAIGLPYLVLASSAPLLQVWQSRSSSRFQADPYFLYAASNAGSLLGLLAYPLVVEPLLTVRQQAFFWSLCFSLFGVLTSICSFILWKKGRSQIDGPVEPKPSSKSKAKKVPPLGYGTLAKWLFLAFLPSSLLLSTTTHLTADVASLPLLWMVPLALYLATYVWAFSARGAATLEFFIRWLPLVLLVIVVVLLTEATEPLVLALLIHLLGLFWIAMVCHGALALSRPPVTQLTNYYLCLAAGGALGGLFNALLAPTIFDSLVEYPAALVLGSIIPAFAFRSSSTPKSSRSQRQWDIVLPLILTLITFGLVIAVQGADLPANRWRTALVVGVPLVICYTFSGRPVRFGLAIGGLLLCNSFTPGVHGVPAERVRSFFGIHRITRDDHHRLLIHGNTEHGRQSLDPARKGEPLAYYSRSGPLGDLFAALAPNDPRRQGVAVLGLGTGAVAAYARPGEHWTFYEIDPSVISLARRHFSYLQDAIDRGSQVSVVPGDARIQIGRAPVKFGLIILDTFSSDSIPTHLFTREAFEIYRERLADGGVLAVHYSSRYFNLQPVLGSLANAVIPPVPAICREDLWVSEPDKLAGKAPSKWAILFKNRQDPLRTQLLSKEWKEIKADDSQRAWTDDYSNVLGAFESHAKSSGKFQVPKLQAPNKFQGPSG